MTQQTYWHTLKPQEVASTLATDPFAGLSSQEASQRLTQYGPNELHERAIKSPWAILREQMSEVMVIILILAALISVGLGIAHTIQGKGGAEEFYDAIAIAVIVVLNAVLGVTQEYRAEKAMAALKKMAVPKVKLRREGQVIETSAAELVPGDVVLLEAGNVVPADCRLVQAANLRVQESALTGESEAVEKSVEVLPREDMAVGDRVNMAYMGTIVTFGRGEGIVTTTGMNTQLGSIAEMIQSVASEPTPLQRRLAELGKGLAIAALILVTIIFVMGLVQGGLTWQNGEKMFLTAITMAVAAVPEGLPAVVTIALALGAQRMLKRKALIRKLLAVETLGSVTVICSDKTGTLTENRMTVTILDVAGQKLNLREHLSRTGVDADGRETHLEVLGEHPAMALLLATGTLCNDASLNHRKDDAEHFSSIGDPTEGALVVAAAHMGLLKGDLEAAIPRVAELPFDSERKRMTTVHRMPSSAQSLPGVLRMLMDSPIHAKGDSCVAFCKGSVDGLMQICSSVWDEGQRKVLDDAARARVARANESLAGQGMRVLGFAVKPMDQCEPSPKVGAVEADLMFVGLVGMIDPPRTEVKDAVATCKAAGIRPVMITGDHPLTAWHIARDLGIADGGKTLTGADLEKMSIQELEAVVNDVSVFARVSPEHKLNIVQALQNRGHIVAMTGDGVNDAPALKKSDIGVAMGITGTDVSKEAADMVLQDDNFATIVASIEEGRVIYDNIRKFIKYLLTTNSGEVWVMLAAPLMGMPLPLIPLQILWINLVTDGLPALALGVEPAEKGVMQRRPTRPDANIFGGGMGLHIIWVGMVMAAVSLLAARWFWHPELAHTAGEEWSEKYFRTMVFTTVTLSQMAHVLAIRSGTASLFRAGLFTNKPLVLAVLTTTMLQFLLIYTPFLQQFFQTVPLTLGDLGISLALSSVVFWAVEIEKIFLRRKSRRQLGN